MTVVSVTVTQLFHKNNNVNSTCGKLTLGVSWTRPRCTVRFWGGVCLGAAPFPLLLLGCCLRGCCFPPLPPPPPVFNCWLVVPLAFTSLRPPPPLGPCPPYELLRFRIEFCELCLCNSPPFWKEAFTLSAIFAAGFTLGFLLIPLTGLEVEVASGSVESDEGFLLLPETYE